jgi:PhzF family phenazine biosynthesis protein
VIIYQVDAFTDKAFSGNPAGVCVLEKPAEEGWMQQVASEMNLSETAFIVKQEEVFGLRWFTPAVEVDLCGHATLAAAHILWERGVAAANDDIRFSTQSGILSARQDSGWIELDFPVEAASETQAPEKLLRALNANPLWIGKNRMDYMLELDAESTVRSLKPNFSLLAEVDCRGVIVTSRAEADDCDFVSRFFGPAAGIDEDPVTGSAHCCLAPYWMEKLGKNPLVARQVSKRGGLLRVSVHHKRTLIAGKAVTVLRCELLDL